MLGRRIRGRIVLWMLVFTAITAVYVAVADSRRTYDERIQANNIISPWDVSNAPPPYIRRSDVKVKKSPQIKPIAPKPKHSDEDWQE